jgi:tight adherence protein B
MELKLLIPSIGVALTILLAAVGLLLIIREQSQRKIRNRLNDVIVAGEHEGADPTNVIVRDMDLSTVPLLNSLLQNAAWAWKLDKLLVQADVAMRLGTFLLLMMVLAAFGLMFTVAVLHKPLVAVPVGLLMGSMPLVYVSQRKKKRVRRFEQQFPDALDMLTNALRAGMALNGAIQVVADESPDPVAKEFAILFEENRLGLDMKEALRKLGERVDSAEVNLFVTATILQRETGGNLVEVLEGTAAIIRDRFRILGDVRTLTAQAKLSGIVLTVLPIVMAGVILTVAPDYLMGLAEDPIGKYMIAMAVMMQIVGFFIMRRIVDIKV